MILCMCIGKEFSILFFELEGAEIGIRKYKKSENSCMKQKIIIIIKRLREIAQLLSALKNIFVE